MVKYPNIPVSFNLMAKPVSALCNLECTYCYYRDKLSMYKDSSFMMEENVLEEYVKQYIGSQASPVVVFSWQGGEPCLAGPDFFQQAIFFQKKYAGNRKIENVIQTNGTLLDDQWCRFLKKNKFLVGISIDGPRGIHDFYRNSLGGSSSWVRVMRGINLLRDNDVTFNTLTTVNARSVKYPVEIYQFLKEIGSKYQQFSPVVERQLDKRTLVGQGLAHPNIMQGASMTSWSVTALKYGEFLNRIFDEWVRKDVGSIFVQMFDSTLASWLGEDPGQCLYQKYCGNALAMEQNGDIFACDHFVYSDHKRGNIMKRPLVELALSEHQVEFGYNKFNALPDQCRSCDYLFACNGECPRNRFLSSGNGEKKRNYLCDGLKDYFSHVAPYMDFMVREIRAGRSILGIKKFLPAKVGGNNKKD